MPRDRRDPELIRAGRERPVRSELPRLRVRYRKDPSIAYLSHLEVIGAVTRSVRRSLLPFSVGNGFARRVRLQFSSSLPVGASSNCEWYDLLLDRPVDAEGAYQALLAATPPALGPLQAGFVPSRLPALEAWLDRAKWSLRLKAPGLSARLMESAIDELAETGSLDFLRGDKPKHVDLSRALVAYACTDIGDGLVDLVFNSRDCAGSASLRPAALVEGASRYEGISALQPCVMSVARLGQWHEDPDGTLKEALPTSALPA